MDLPMPLSSETWVRPDGISATPEKRVETTGAHPRDAVDQVDGAWSMSAE
jgi:hypothetical protein